MNHFVHLTECVANQQRNIWKKSNSNNNSTAEWLLHCTKTKLGHEQNRTSFFIIHTNIPTYERTYTHRIVQYVQPYIHSYVHVACAYHSHVTLRLWSAMLSLFALSECRAGIRFSSCYWWKSMFQDLYAYISVGVGTQF